MTCKVMKIMVIISWYNKRIQLQQKIDQLKFYIAKHSEQGKIRI